LVQSIMSKTVRRKAEAGLQSLLILSDVAALLIAVGLAYELRFHSLLTALVPITKGVPERSLYLQGALALSAAWVPTFALLGLYRARLGLDFATQLEHATRGVLVGALIAFTLTFFYREASFSRLTLAMAVLLLFLLVPAMRTMVVGRLAPRLLPPSGLAVCGSGRGAIALAARLRATPEPFGWFVGRFGDDDGGKIGEPPIGRLAEITEAVRAGTVDRVLLALGIDEIGRARQLVARLTALEAEVEWVPDLHGLAIGQARTDQVAGMPALVLGEFPLLGWNGVVKRAMDLGLTSVGVVTLAPFLALIAILIKVSSSGPVIYRQERVGRDGRHFQMFKFRTMVEGAERGTGPIAARREDPRVTRIGGFLRRTSLDELPQLVNVLRGEMSLVGPRPERPCFVTDLASEIPAYLGRQRVKSGMTGWAQIHHLRGGESSIAERVRCDLYYIENWSLGLDLRILVRTVLTLHRQRNAY
jgi:exopolysaccharide biosynthesis polyprenyl glycosylphosphotransferase